MTLAKPGPGERVKSHLILVPFSEPSRPVPGRDPVSELWAAHGRALLRFACKLTLGDQHKAEDIVQETLMRAWRHPEITSAGPAPLRPWLFTIARHIAIDMWRAHSRGIEETPDPGHTDVPDPADPIKQAITAVDVRGALATLTPAHRQIITEIYYRNRSVAETAAILGIPPGTVKSRAHYATRHLRDALIRRPVAGRPGG
ncbi:MAG TPA: sigma-70 family RNA polymerase sigma factor [Streptosporangiaceae bacterium]|nr:sigma-70 family RNA polymerase sigma factor [Streptosporangiaceae bacterium]